MFIIDTVIKRNHFYIVALCASFLLLGCKTEHPITYRIPSSSHSNSFIQLDTISWTISSDWVPKEASNFRIGSYELMTINGDILDLSINRIPGEAGGIDANINRWRQQLQLPALSHEDLDKTILRPATTLPFIVVDLISQAPINQSYRRTLAAILTDENYTYFIKLSGTYYAVNNHKDDFMALLETIKTDH